MMRISKIRFPATTIKNQTYFFSTKTTTAQNRKNRSLYDDNKSEANKMINKKIDAKLDTLKPHEKPTFPYHFRKRAAQSPTSFDNYQKEILPKKIQNMRRANKIKNKTSHADWTFWLHDEVKVVKGIHKDQEGIVSQYFRELNEVVVKGVNMYIENPSTNDENANSGIYSVEGPMKSDFLKHFGYETATIAFGDKLDQNLVKKAISKRLNLCDFCGEFQVQLIRDKSITFSLRLPEKDCQNTHKGIERLSSLKPSEYLTLDDNSIYIEQVEVHTKPEEILNVKMVSVPQKPFCKNQRVVSMLENHFSKRGTVTETYLNQILVKFDDEEKVSGPFNTFYFAALENGKIVKNTPLLTYNKRVVYKLLSNKVFPFDLISFPAKPKPKTMMQTFYEFPQTENFHLNTSVEDAVSKTI
ncbi:hypothetical protein MHBO_000672 [Bonamia ostreae]|uniref:Uncharacterized protein n=1 Tax=Bonamia ostreae TaxID=126728 RepID=A0ABV2AGF5_9EUKA